MAERQTVNVVAAIKKEFSLQTVVGKLAERGLVVDSTLDKLRLVTGSVDPAKMQTLSEVPGVSYLREQGTAKTAQGPVKTA
jgi:hypothetical protein